MFLAAWLPATVKENTVTKTPDDKKVSGTERPLAKKRLSRTGEAAPKKPKISVREPGTGRGRRPAGKTGPNRRERRSFEKGGTLHSRNPHQGRYDMEALTKTLPELQQYLRPNPAGEDTIDFADADAVFCLNQALLAHFYKVDDWQVPMGYLCPPIPGRVDYIHYAADLLTKYSKREYKHDRVKVLDIGTGANLIYPIVGSQSYGWKFVGSEIDAVAVKAAQRTIDNNAVLSGMVELRLQRDAESIFDGLIEEGEFYHLSMCNPPFYASAAEARMANEKKVGNLARHRIAKGLVEEPQEPVVAEAEAVEPAVEVADAVADSSDPWAKAKKVASESRAESSERNFGGQNAELWVDGGELAFIERMARESRDYADQVGWFSTLVSRQENVEPLLDVLAEVGAQKTEIVKMTQGQKISRFVAWRFKR